MFDPGAWGRSRSGRPIGLPVPRVVYALARALGQRQWQRCLRRRRRRRRHRCPRPRMRQQRRCVGAKMGQGDGRTEPKVGLSDALGERRVGGRERDLVAQGERSHAAR